VIDSYGPVTDAATAFPLRARLEAEFARGGDLAGDDRHARALAHAAIPTMPGLPVIYYGDEVGLGQRLSLPDGADFADRWFREPMPWDDADGDRELCERVAALARLRTTTPAPTPAPIARSSAKARCGCFERRHEGDPRLRECGQRRRLEGGRWAGCRRSSTHPDWPPVTAAGVHPERRAVTPCDVRPTMRGGCARFATVRNQKWPMHVRRVIFHR
jgi:hypothetical protein